MHAHFLAVSQRPIFRAQSIDPKADRAIVADSVDFVVSASSKGCVSLVSKIAELLKYKLRYLGFHTIYFCAQTIVLAKQVAQGFSPSRIITQMVFSNVEYLRGICDNTASACLFVRGNAVIRLGNIFVAIG